jgi:N-acetylglucosamine kinase-like BadF-type ATPase
MGGVDTPFQHELISGVIAAMGFSRFVLSNDAYLGIKAECQGPGICAVNGTGYSVAGIGENGEMLQIGGHNENTGDMGGSSHLVPAAIRAVYTQLFKRGPETQMTAAFFDWLGIRGRDDFCQAVAQRCIADEISAFHRISRILYLAAGKDDPAALGILSACGEDYALSVRCAAEDLKLKAPVDVILAGSHFTKCENDHAIRAMEKRLNPPESEKMFRLKVISTVPVAGALFWAMELSGVPCSGELQETLRGRLKCLGGGEPDEKSCFEYDIISPVAR